MQKTYVVVGDRIELVALPDPEMEVMPSVPWGDSSLMLTPAWWAKHGRTRTLLGWYDSVLRREPGRLEEDVVECLLGGFGITFELADAAYGHLVREGLFQSGGPSSCEAIEALLRQPLNVGGRTLRYRFPANRARYISSALSRLRAEPVPRTPLALRDHLLSFRGIGPKTASWIVRNHLGSDEVAIIDIHILRAGRLARLFPGDLDVARDYACLERLFLTFAERAGVRPSIMDLTMWDMMRRLSPTLRTTTTLLAPARDLAAQRSVGNVAVSAGRQG